MHSTRLPRRPSTPWGVASVHFAHAREGNTFKCRSSFVVEVRRCWRSGYAMPEGLEPDAAYSLERHFIATESNQLQRLPDGRRSVA